MNKVYNFDLFENAGSDPNPEACERGSLCMRTSAKGGQPPKGPSSPGGGKPAGGRGEDISLWP